LIQPITRKDKFSIVEQFPQHCLSLSVKFCSAVLILVLLVGLLGCSVIQKSVYHRPVEEKELRSLLASSSDNLPAGLWLDYARRGSLEDAERLAAFLEAAKLALPSALAEEREGRLIYEDAVRQVVAILEENEWNPRLLEEKEGVMVLQVMHGNNKLFDPSAADELLVASTLKVGGLMERVTREGVGVPYVAWVRQDSPVLAGEPGISRNGLALPLTAILSFPGRMAQLEFVQTMDRDSWVIDGQPTVLAADYSAPIAYLIARGRNRAIDPAALFFTDRHFENAGLLQFQPYDPDKVPVVFVHGLLSRPEAWTQALNLLQADPEIRKRYQFWFYLYPTGLPVWASAAILRKELDRFNETLQRRSGNALLQEKILVGHSMGGLISSLLVRKGEGHLWRQFSDADFDRLQISKENREKLRMLLFFSPREDISRVVFMATPHRGSPLALRPLAGFMARMVRLPPMLLDPAEREEALRHLRDDQRSLFVAPANSIRFLRAGSPLLLSILELPMTRKIPFHSIIGNRGRDLPPELSSDGVVPYLSAHLEGAASEQLVPSGHGVNEHPEGIAELKRILLEH